MKYQNTRNGREAIVVSENEKTKILTIEYLDNGQTADINPSTLKRWWKPIEDQDQDPVVDTKKEQVTAAIKKAVKDQKAKAASAPKAAPKAKTKTKPSEDDDKAGDGTPLAEVGKEIAAQAKAKAKEASASKPKKGSAPKAKKPRAIKPDAAYIAEAKDYVYGIVNKFGDEIFSPAKDIKMNAFKVGGHMYCKFNYSKSSITVAVKPDAIKGSKDIRKPDATVNHMFGSVYKFTDKLTAEDKKLIKSLLTAGRTYRLSKNENSGKTKKTKKEAK